jgi:hypothetical protein
MLWPHFALVHWGFIMHSFTCRRLQQLAVPERRGVPVLGFELVHLCVPWPLQGTQVWTRSRPMWGLALPQPRYGLMNSVECHENYVGRMNSVECYENNVDRMNSVECHENKEEAKLCRNCQNLSHYWESLRKGVISDFIFLDRPFVSKRETCKIW